MPIRLPIIIKIKHYKLKVLMKNYFRLNELSCIVYLDSVKKLGKGIYDIAIDFRLPSDVNTFNNVIGSNLTSSTYLELRNMKTSKRLRTGCSIF